MPSDARRREPRRRLWPKLLAGLLVIALCVFAGVRLYRTMLGLLGVLASDAGEPDPVGEYAPEAEWTPPPYLPDDAAYDDVTGVREYEEDAPEATAAADTP